jgi:hypothetical protein
VSAEVELPKGWAKWKASENGLEQKVFSLPMAETRELLQRSLKLLLEFPEKRTAYSHTAATFIEKHGDVPGSGHVVVTVEAVFLDQIELLGINTEAIQTRLASLRDSDDWLSIRDSVQQPRNAVLALAASRRSTFPADFLTKPRKPVDAMSVVPYLDSDREVAESLRNLWTS